MSWLCGECAEGGRRSSDAASTSTDPSICAVCGVGRYDTIDDGSSSSESDIGEGEEAVVPAGLRTAEPTGLGGISGYTSLRVAAEKIMEAVRLGEAGIGALRKAILDVWAERIDADAAAVDVGAAGAGSSRSLYNEGGADEELDRLVAELEESSTVGNPLHACCEAGQAACAVMLVAEFGFSLTAETDARGVALHAAVRGASLPLVNFILSYPPSDTGVNRSITSYSGDTPLTLAAAGGHVEIARALLEAGARPDGTRADAETPLSIAVSSNNVNMAKLLLQAGANPLIALLDSVENPLSRAVGKQNSEMVSLLMPAATAHWNAASWLLVAKAALRAAAHDEDLRLLERFLQVGAVWINEQIKYHGTLLHVAVHEASPSVRVALCKLLLAHGADVRIKSTAYGRSPLELAQKQFEQAVRLAEDDAESGMGATGAAAAADECFESGARSPSAAKQDVEAAVVALLEAQLAAVTAAASSDGIMA